jgi:DNA-binding SARP family transcriptional activator/Tfp pilus assembly protein PilF
MEQQPIDGEITLLIFDGLSVRHAGHDLKIASRKNRALLAKLFLDGSKIHARADLAQLIWPNVPLQQARASLRTSLFDLRKQLGVAFDGLVVLGKVDIRVNADSAITDLDQLIGELSRGTWSDTTRARLQMAGAILSELDGIGSEFEEWMHGLRVQVSKRVLDALAIGSNSNKADKRSQINLARAAVRLDEYNETCARTLMRLYVEDGQNAAGLRIYDALFRRLEIELDVEPSAETQQLAVEIKLLEVSAPPMPAQPPKDFDREGIAVLPFETLGPHSVPDYVTLGLLDEVTCLLAGGSIPRLISSNSTRHYIGQMPDPQDVGAALGVRYVLMGKLYQHPDETRVATQLIDTLSNGVERARMDRFKGGGILEHQTDMATRIAAAVLPTVQLAELRRTHGLPVNDLEPYHLYLRARQALFQLDLQGFKQAQTLLERAIDKAPYFAQAHALLAEWHSIHIWQGWSDDPYTSGAELERLARRALSLNPTDARSLSLLAHHLVITYRDYDGALKMFDRALDLLPNDAETLIWTVPSLAFIGEAEQAITHAERALWLSPQDPFLFRNLHFLSIAQFAAGRFGAAARSGLSAYKKNPRYTSNLRMTIAALIRHGDEGEAARLAGLYIRQDPAFRVSEHILKVAFRDVQSRVDYGDALRASGLPS